MTAGATLTPSSLRLSLITDPVMAPPFLFTERLMLRSLHSGPSLGAIRSSDEATVAGLSRASVPGRAGHSVSQSPQLAHYMTGRKGDLGGGESVEPANMAIIVG